MGNDQVTETAVTVPFVAPPGGDGVGCVIVDRTAHAGDPGAGRHTRTAVGTADVPFTIPVAVGSITRPGN